MANAARCLQMGDIKGLGQLMYGSHDGLSREYEVSCPELDWLADAVRSRPGVAGGRMMGGGFGGCTINLVKTDAIDGLVSEVSAGYRKAMNKELTAYVAKTADGTGSFSE